MFILTNLAVLPATAGEVGKNPFVNILTSKTSWIRDGKTEYWAVLIGVDFNSPLGRASIIPFEEYVDGMYSTLLTSDHWRADHIKLITDRNATKINIIKALRWLGKMADGDDVCLIYYVGHGGYLHLKAKKLGSYIPIDLPPLDEKDRCDEFITTYWSGKNPFAIITDDLLNNLLNRIHAKGVAVVLDSCYSGGMSDIGNNRGFFRRFFNHSLSNWMRDFSIDISKKGRVTLMACGENETALLTGAKMFGSGFVREGLQGYADSNGDGMVSAEETFAYGAPRYKELCNSVFGENVYPIIDDRYDGELVLTDAELPPSSPNLSSRIMIGIPGEVFNFNVSSIDPENDRIRYGWNWRNDNVNEYSKFWGYNVEEWSEYYNSGEVCTMRHSWVTPGVYTVRVKAQDEHGAEIIPDGEYYSGLWTEPSYILIPSDNETVDQYQIKAPCGLCINAGNLVAQSFTSNATSLSKIKLKLTSLTTDDTDLEYKQKYPLNVSIRSNLSGEDIAKVSKKPYAELHFCKDYKWVEFDFSNITLTPGEKYYIAVSCDSPLSLYCWLGFDRSLLDPDVNSSDPYLGGESYSYEPLHLFWYPETYNDFCFITYE